jgi:drug/metabolite transporter (DMT)-like permease
MRKEPRQAGGSGLGLLYIALSIAGFSLIGIGAKFADSKRCHAAPLCAMMCVWAMAAASVFALGTGRGLRAPAGVSGIAFLFGISAVIGILALQNGVRYGKISTSWLIINLSAAVPAAGSVLVYHEQVNPRKALALALVVISVVLLWLDKNRDPAKELRKI